MSGYEPLRILFAVCFGIVCAAATAQQGLNKAVELTDYKVFDPKRKEEKQDRPKYMFPNWAFNLLLICILSPFVLLLSPLDGLRKEEVLLQVTVPVIFTICLYYIVLIPIIPLLRKYFHSYACAVLWMIPSMLYLACYRWMQRTQPARICVVPRQWIHVGFRIWFAGFLLVLIIPVLRHLQIRKKLLAAAHPCSDPAVNDLFNRLREEYCGDKFDLRLLYCPVIKTPLSIGLFRRSTCVLLPQRAYSEEELELIFRHELIHICRRDSGVKFLIAFCRALCWFNPFMHLAMRRCSEDMELSCDQLVLKDAGQEKSEQYASLILDTAAEPRGFTTCLSANARSMAYRLKQILQPAKKWKGTLLVGLVTALLLYSLGWFSFACDVGTIKDLSMEHGSSDPSDWTISSISSWNNIAGEAREIRTALHTSDLQALTDTITALECLELAGFYTLKEDGPEINVWYQTDGGLCYASVSAHMVTLGYPIKNTETYGSRIVSTSYLLKEPADMDYLLSLIEAK